MNIPADHRTVSLSGRQCSFLGVAWLLIAVKCILVTWAIRQWDVPIHPLWIVGPTILFAGLATALWATHRE